jgi:O-antigen/teichoic acid export membrane protein
VVERPTRIYRGSMAEGSHEAGAETGEPPRSAQESSADWLRGRVIRGVAWKVLSQLVVYASAFAVALILARLLTPRDFGLAGMVLLFTQILPLMADLALGNALIQRPRLTEADRSTVFWTSVGAGALLTLLGIGLSWPLADFYGEPSVQPLFAVLSLSFLISSLGAAHNALLVREMNFRGLEIRTISGTLVGAFLGIALALAGYGPWAIIAQQVAGYGVSTALLWIFSQWRPRFTFSLASLKDLGSFSGNIFGANVFLQLNRNADSLLIGRVLGATPLGLYTLASNVILLPFNRIATPIQQVLFPAFSRIQDDLARMATAWLRVTRLVAAIAAPSLVGLAIVADDFVTVVIGDKWSGAVPVIQILAWVGLLHALQSLNPSVLQACNRPGVLFRYSALQFAVGLVAVIAGLPFGIVGVAVAYAIATTLLQPLYAWMTARALGVSMLDVGKNLFGVVQAAAVMGACVLGGRELLVAWEVAPAARLGLLVTLGALSFAVVCRLRAPEIVRELRDLRRRRSAVRTTPEPPPLEPRVPPEAASRA